jgi:outer membrane receptor protein involved in Fe transport
MFHRTASAVDRMVPIWILPTDADEIIRGNVATRAANIAGQRTRGIEVVALGDLGLVDFFASYSYQDARHDDLPVGSPGRAALASVGVIAGERVRNIPRHSAYGEIGVKPVEGARIQANLRYVGDRVGGHLVAATSFREVGVETIPGYVVANAGASYTLRDAGPFSGYRSSSTSITSSTRRISGQCRVRLRPSRSSACRR